MVGLAETRFDWPDAMRQLALALPSDVTLTSMSATPAGGDRRRPTAAATTTTRGGVAVALTGCASSQAEVATVIQRLAQRARESTDVTLGNVIKTGAKAPNAGRRSLAARRPRRRR